jgi:hypothetical protein
MALVHERVVLADGAQIEIAFDPPAYRLAWHSRSARVRYESEGDGRHRRLVRARRLAYEFRSVEQLRYDFERDIEAAGGSLGGHA